LKQPLNPDNNKSSPTNYLLFPQPSGSKIGPPHVQAGFICKTNEAEIMPITFHENILIFLGPKN
jgi:hypothetical protein